MNRRYSTIRPQSFFLTRPENEETESINKSAGNLIESGPEVQQLTDGWIDRHLLLGWGLRMTRNDVDPDASLGRKQFLPDGPFRIFFRHFHHLRHVLLLLPLLFAFVTVVVSLPNRWIALAFDPILPQFNGTNQVNILRNGHLHKYETVRTFQSIFSLSFSLLLYAKRLIQQGNSSIQLADLSQCRAQTGRTCRYKKPPSQKTRRSKRSIRRHLAPTETGESWLEKSEKSSQNENLISRKPTWGWVIYFQFSQQEKILFKKTKKSNKSNPK